MGIKCDYYKIGDGDAIYWGSFDPGIPIRRIGPWMISDTGRVEFEESEHSERKGPTVISPRGTCVYKKDGVRHRTNGPAVILLGKHNQYFVNGVEIPHLEFLLKYGVV